MSSSINQKASDKDENCMFSPSGFDKSYDLSLASSLDYYLSCRVAGNSRERKMRKKNKPTKIIRNPIEDDDDGGQSEREDKDIEQTESEAQNESLELEGHCICRLCEEKLDTGTGREDIDTPTGSSDSTYATVLNTLFNNSEQASPLFSSGKICLPCKDHIKELDLVQSQVIGVEKEILDRASQKLEGISGEQEEEVSSPNLDVVEEEDVVTDDADVKMAVEKQRPVATAKKVLPPISSYKRPRREKNSMSEIERAKIKNLKSDLKFSVKKKNQTEVFIIEYLKEKNETKYLVKWENRHESENTWEPRNKIPRSVLQVFRLS